ncbi:hypothetical protein IGI04_008550 [Brassica rapa subsp. trilocularis]|uniref:Peptidylprolyl isomerase n=1 Tax=Brassica rapa subsp. trilocularis TaxID=1813537 RepID=A0ABQ7NMZ1_BRACM|nr:hypothetical protein IGI04_008548 [Brassica rapa subsp. trilocularis]KAG5412231.1 hypothetical protein IGI04_008550 [Brassica rapa subsp. trilocularis]
MGSTVFLLSRPCEAFGVDELVLGMSVLRDSSLLDVKLFLASELYRGSLRIGSLVDSGGRGTEQLRG